MCIIKASSLGSRVVVANFLQFMSLTLFFVSKTLIIIYFLYFNSLFINLTLALDKERNDIFNTILMLVLATREIF